MGDVEVTSCTVDSGAVDDNNDVDGLSNVTFIKLASVPASSVSGSSEKVTLDGAEYSILDDDDLCGDLVEV